jgi:hypothetical protein
MRRTCLVATGIGLMVMAAGAGFRMVDGEPGPGQLGPDQPNAAMAREAAKEQIARSVARGETGLAEAAAQFRKLHADDATDLEPLRSWHPAASDEELYAWNVITHVRGLLGRFPAEAAKRVAELEAELATAGS